MLFRSRFVYVECTDGLEFRKIPPSKAMRLARSCLAVATSGHPERLGAIHIGPASKAQRFILKLVAPLIPERVRHRIQLHSSTHELRRVLEAMLPSPGAVPDFLGGPARHELPRLASGDVDIVGMTDSLRFPVR